MSKKSLYTACAIVFAVYLAISAGLLTMVYKTHKAVERIEVVQSHTSDIGTPTDEEIHAWMQACGQRRQKLLAEGHEAKPCG